MERVRCARSVSGGVGERIDDLELLDDRTGPPVRDDEWQGVLVLGADVDEMNVQAVDLGDEVRLAFPLRLPTGPLAVRFPGVRELLHHLERDPLRIVCHRLALRPPGRAYTPAQVG